MILVTSVGELRAFIFLDDELLGWFGLVFSQTIALTFNWPNS